MREEDACFKEAAVELMSAFTASGRFSRRDRAAPYYVQDASKDIKGILSDCDYMSENFNTAAWHSRRYLQPRCEDLPSAIREKNAPFQSMVRNIWTTSQLRFLSEFSCLQSACHEPS